MFDWWGLPTYHISKFFDYQLNGFGMLVIMTRLHY